VAPPAGTLRVGRYFLALIAILAVLYGIVFWPGQRHTPKLGLDLVGGTQVIFTAKAPGGKTPSGSSMEQAKQIMQDRVNGSGVTEATVVIQGADQIVVSIPGSTTTDVSKLGAAAALNFRGLIAPAAGVACVPQTSAPSGSASTAPASGTQGSPAASQPSGSASVHDAGHRLLAAPATPAPASPTPLTPSPSAPAGASPSPAPASSVPPPPCTDTPFAALESSGVTIPTSEAELSTLPAATQTQITQAMSSFNCAAARDSAAEPDLPNKYYLACDDKSQLVYLLGSVIVPGREISTASAVAPNIANGQTQWTVSLELKSGGQSAWGKYTTAHNVNGKDTGANPTTCSPTTIPCADFVAFTLDGNVISAPVNESGINGGATQITGNFTQASANDLANKLKYGALPLSFKADQAQTVSATLGTSQLKSGLLAGGIGLVLVVIYSLIYYRALGLVTISSLIVSGGLTYGALVMLGTQIGFTLSLAGIAGFIVAVGITADSFVVFFERIKDEVHEGRSMRVAIPRAWVRARRTILSADTVSFLAAAILYYFAAGDVKGFAFTLGLSTILDLVVVFLFTHPLVSWLSRQRAFGSARFTGLNAVREGGVVTAGTDESAPRRRIRPATRAAGGPVRPATAAVGVLDREDGAGGVEDIDAEPLPPRADSATQPPRSPAADGDRPSAPADDVASSARGRGTPVPGSAAERAAERRARMRHQGDEKGER
jgi:preprotein translocase subunit SecD